MDPEFASAWYLACAAAFVRGRLGAKVPEDDLAAAQHGIAAGLRLYRFKRNAELPRVRRVLGILQGLAPTDLCDIGSGRGTFLWPVLDTLPGLPVTAIEADPIRARDLGAVAVGGMTDLRAVRGDATHLGIVEDAFDVSCALEVLEHMRDPAQAAAELLRVTRRFVIVSVPSREDDNPEHIQLFSADSLRALFLDAGAARVTIESVPGHFVGVVRVG